MEPNKPEEYGEQIKAEVLAAVNLICKKYHIVGIDLPSDNSDKPQFEIGIGLGFGHRLPANINTVLTHFGAITVTANEDGTPKRAEGYLPEQPLNDGSRFWHQDCPASYWYDGDGKGEKPGLFKHKVNGSRWWQRVFWLGRSMQNRIAEFKEVRRADDPEIRGLFRTLQCEACGTRVHVDVV